MYMKYELANKNKNNGKTCKYNLELLSKNEIAEKFLQTTHLLHGIRKTQVCSLVRNILLYEYAWIYECSSSIFLLMLFLLSSSSLIQTARIHAALRLLKCVHRNSVTLLSVQYIYLNFLKVIYDLHLIKNSTMLKQKYHSLNDVFNYILRAIYNSNKLQNKATAGENYFKLKFLCIFKSKWKS